MSKLSRKESIAIATIHDALRELRIKGRQAQVNMMFNEISISDSAETSIEAKELRNLFSFFKDNDDTIEVRKYNDTYEVSEFWIVRLKKRLL